jgi:hypothetical protein
MYKVWIEINLCPEVKKKSFTAETLKELKTAQ